MINRKISVLVLAFVFAFLAFPVPAPSLAQSPGIHITKTSSVSSVTSGSVVNFTFGIANVGDVDLFNVNVTDNYIGALAGPLTLAINENLGFSRLITLYANMTNTATVIGETSSSVFVTAQATWTVIVTNGLVGDLNGDGKVNILDLVATAGHFGESDPGVVPPLFGTPDVNHDGIVDIFDLIIIVNHWTG